MPIGLDDDFTPISGYSELRSLTTHYRHRKGTEIKIGRGAITAMELYVFTAKWALVALALGRRLVLPYVECELHRTRETSLRSSMQGNHIAIT